MAWYRSSCLEVSGTPTVEEQDIVAVREKYPHARLKAVYEGFLVYKDGITSRPRWRIAEGPSTSMTFSETENAWKYAREMLSRERL